MILGVALILLPLFIFVQILQMSVLLDIKHLSHAYWCLKQYIPKDKINTLIIPKLWKNDAKVKHMQEVVKSEQINYVLWILKYDLIYYLEQTVTKIISYTKIKVNETFQNTPYSEIIHILSNEVCCLGNTKFYKALLNYKKDDISIQTLNSHICVAADFGYVDILKLLLKDDRLNPSNSDNCALTRAVLRNHIEVVELLTNDNRVQPLWEESYVIQHAKLYNYHEVVFLIERHIKNKKRKL